MTIVSYSANPFARESIPEHVSAGTVSIESERAISEAQGKLIIAKRFPRDQARAYQRVMESCSRPSFAATAEYAFPRGSQTVRGPSIRLAEELARCWGNLDYGIRELSRKDGVSEMEAYCWDLETNTISSQKFTVRHIRDTKGGGKALSDERDIYELTANQGGRRLRARILAILPPDLVDAALEKCRETLAGNSAEPIIDRVRKMLTVFGQFGVGEKHLSQYLGKSLDEVIPSDLADLASVYNSIKTGTADVSEFFGKAESAQVSDLNARLAAQAQDRKPESFDHHPKPSNGGASEPNKADSTSTPEPEPKAPEWPQANDDGELIDARGIAWDERIHSSSRNCNEDGTWRRKRGVDPKLVERLEHEAVAKGEPETTEVTLHSIMTALDAAETAEDLIRALEPVQALPDDEKEQARNYYRERRAAIVAGQQASDQHQTDDGSANDAPMTFETIRDGLYSAASEDEIAAWWEESQHIVISASQRMALEQVRDGRIKSLNAGQAA